MKYRMSEILKELSFVMHRTSPLMKRIDLCSTKA